MSTPASRLADALDAALPQTQCRRCGLADCRAYAQAIAEGTAAIDRCPPGGRQGIERLARLTGQAPRPLDPAVGAEGPRRLAVIDEAACIGCTRCLDACPVDAIVGAAKAMHTVIDAHCTGCELCLPACPVDCISLVDASGARTGWDAWSAAQADAARARYAARRERLARQHREREQRLHAARPTRAPVDAPAPTEGEEDRRAVIAAALARARARR